MSLTAKVNRLMDKLHRKLKKMRLHPISVFLFHQVSNVFEEDTMKMGDWTEIGQFKNNIELLVKKYKFISLEKAYYKIRNDKFRFRNYAVLTSDDGWASLKNVLPWLNEKKIPVTLFLNPGYFDGQHFREKDSEKYLLIDDVESLSRMYPNVTIGMHGWEHVRATEQNESEFRDSVLKSLKALQVYPNNVPYFAYTYGSFNEMNDRVLKEFGIIPVLIDREKNIDDLSCIHRELLDGIKI